MHNRSGRCGFGLARGSVFSASMVEMISQSAAGNHQMFNKFKMMLADELNLGFAVDLDARVLWDQFYTDVQNLGGRRWDNSQLLKRLQAMG